MSVKLSDIELIDLALEGNQGAYVDLINRHQRYVFTLALRFTKNREDAEEVAQDSFLKAFRSLTAFQRNSKFTTWLYSIVYTTAMSKLRKSRLDTDSLDDVLHPVYVENYSTEDTSRGLENKVQKEYINKAIERLLPDDGMIISLFYLAEQSLEEIAQVMNMPANTVKVKLHRARQRLKIQLEQLLKHEINELL
ncbi:RNA polymerase sigma factor [Solitalea koreensis]|uniref:RNA polymerase sigma factor n=1 Tax=Solitalea koreensis TaxID=543615 RepID=A0A521BX83_9SPHI|nr:RNA polymerase sigma factor [Solitalea koreensis]SMO51793.1 RNA polymerase sigma-70 factor, ECF subfamily [Solitalea koreensis]